ncbi:FAD:protein FMN transferase, partial [Intestinimonas massiliensis]
NDYPGLNNLKTVNDRVGEAPVEVDRRIIDLLLEAREMYGVTGGKVNVAFGSVLSIWHDYREAGIPDPERAALPPMEALRAAAEHTDPEAVVIDEERST